MNIPFLGLFSNQRLVCSVIVVICLSIGCSAPTPRATVDFQQVSFDLSDNWEPWMLKMLNKDRKNKGLHTLKIDEKLSHIAQSWTETMARDGFCAHVHPNDSNLTANYRIVLFNRYQIERGDSLLKLDYLAENVGFAIATRGEDTKNLIKEVWKGFMNSRTHRKNMRSKNSSIVGFGFAYGKMKNQKTLFVTQIFGDPSDYPQHFLGSDKL